MYCSNCEQCVFLDKSKTCNVNQLYNVGNETIATFGVCKFFRTTKWVGLNRSQNLSELESIAQEELGLSFDMIVLYDPSKHSEEDLSLSLDDWWHKPWCKKIVVANIGETENPNSQIRQLLSYSCVKSIPSENLKINIAIERNPNGYYGEILRLSDEIKSRLFMVVEAGNAVVNLTYLDRLLQGGNFPGVFWHFPEIGMGRSADDRMSNNVTLYPRHPVFGLYMTNPYRALATGAQSFADDLNNEEINPSQYKLDFSVSECLIA